MCLSEPAQVVEVAAGSAVVLLRGRQFVVKTAMLPELKAGDWVLVMAGYAVELVDQADALAISELLAELEADACDIQMADEAAGAGERTASAPR